MDLSGVNSSRPLFKTNLGNRLEEKFRSPQRTLKRRSFVRESYPSALDLDCLDSDEDDILEINPRPDVPDAQGPETNGYIDYSFSGKPPSVDLDGKDETLVYTQITRDISNKQDGSDYRSPGAVIDKPEAIGEHGTKPKLTDDINNCNKLQKSSSIEYFIYNDLQTDSVINTNTAKPARDIDEHIEHVEGTPKKNYLSIEPEDGTAEPPKPGHSAGFTKPPEPEYVGLAGEPPRSEPVASNDEHPKPEPVTSNGEPPKPEPVASNGEPPRPESVASNGEPPKPEPVASNGEPPKPEPVASNGEPVASNGEPPRPEPVASNGEPPRPEPVASNGEPPKPEPIASNGEPPKPEPISGADATRQPVPATMLCQGPEGFRPAFHPAVRSSSTPTADTTGDLNATSDLYAAGDLFAATTGAGHCTSRDSTNTDEFTIHAIGKVISGSDEKKILESLEENENANNAEIKDYHNENITKQEGKTTRELDQGTVGFNLVSQIN